jgi:ABC-type cobalt transport system substrate-binding protein
MQNCKKKRYVLTIIWDPLSGDIEHLAEEFSDLDKIVFEINGYRLNLSKELQKEMETINTEILGLS